MRIKRAAFWILTLAGPLAFLGLAGYLLWPQIERAASERLLAEIPVARLIDRLPAEGRARLYDRLAATTPGPWDVDPDPSIARLMKRQQNFTMNGVAVASNNAGLRSETPYAPKGEAFRIVVLGDSVAMGAFVEERERMGERMEAILRERGVTVDGRPMEVLTLALNGWTTVMETRYLAARFSAYQPDIVSLLMVDNDIDTDPAVSGSGIQTAAFSPMQRAHGSGYFSATAPGLFGNRYRGPYASGLGPQSRAAWQRAFEGIERLESLVLKSGGHMVIAIASRDPAFDALAIDHHRRMGLKSALILSPYHRDRSNLLVDDPHPSPAGHQALALHQLHLMAARGWLPVERAELPALPDIFALEPPRTVTKAEIGKAQAHFIERLSDSLDFRGDFEAEQAYAFLGGIWPARPSKPTSEPPQISTRGGLLLKRRPEAERLLAEIAVPPRVELFPLALEMSLDGAPAASLRLERTVEAGVHRIEAPLPADPADARIVEVIFTAERTSSRIVDGTMRSVSLLRVWQE